MGEHVRNASNETVIDFQMKIIIFDNREIHFIIFSLLKIRYGQNASTKSEGKNVFMKDDLLITKKVETNGKIGCVVAPSGT